MSRRLKVALFWPTLQTGGVERRMITTARELVLRGYQVDIVVIDSRGDLRRDIPKGTRLIELGTGLGTGKLILAVFPLRSYLADSRPDVLWSATTQANIVAILAKVMNGGTPWVIVSERSTLSRRVGKGPKGRLLPILAKLLYPRADRIHAVSTGVADDLSQLTGIARDTINVIYNPVISAETLALSETKLDHPWFGNGEPPVILGVGRLVRAKGFDVLIEAFAITLKRRPMRLVIVGEGPERSALEQKARQLGLAAHVDFVGFDQNPHRYMRRAAVFVLSSRWEGLPAVLIEALATGVPVVSTDCPSGPREILLDGKIGELVPVDAPNDLAEAILKVLDEWTPENAESARRRAWEFSVDVVVDRLLQELFPSTPGTHSDCRIV